MSRSAPSRSPSMSRPSPSMSRPSSGGMSRPSTGASRPSGGSFNRPTATPRPTRTPTSIPAETPTPFPTLEPEEKLDFILEMLETNGGCQLPCWWGVTPGETRWEQVEESFTERGVILGQRGWLDLDYLDPEVGYRFQTLDVRFQQEAGLVRSISIETDYHYLLAQQDFSWVWQRYTLESILSRYGVPSQVYLDLVRYAGDWSPGLRQYYDLWIVYDSLGIAVRYPGMLIRDNRGWLICPVLFSD